MSYNVLKYVLFLICTFCYSFAVSSETYIDYDGLSKIELNMNKDNVVSVLGEPILVLADSEYDNTIYLLYNYKIKQFNLKGDNIALGPRNYKNTRSTLLKLTFVDDELISWEEDKATLSMAGGKTPSGNSFLHYFSMLLNIILLIKII